MTRDTFLQEIWKPYPAIQSARSGFVFGRFVKKQDDLVTLKVKGLEENYNIFRPLSDDEQFGPSIPVEFLNQDDVVAYKKESGEVYLLSPAAEKCNIKLQSSELRWSQFLEKVHSFFKKEEFFQARTPFLVESPGVDHHIDYLKVEGVSTKNKWSLPTSPEISLKKLLCSGFENIYEIKKCFRDDLPGIHHKTEFTMLEFYQSFVDLKTFAGFVKSFLEFVFDSELAVKNSRLDDIFEKQTSFPLTPSTSLEELKNYSDAMNIEFRDDDDWNDIFFRIYMEKIEPFLGFDGPEFVFMFPPQQASLSRLSKKGWAQRFEIYWQGVELGNAYLEVNSPDENRRVFLSEQEKRSQSGSVTAPIDESFFQYLQQGMPPGCGIAIGLDRLFMLSQGEESV